MAYPTALELVNRVLARIRDEQVTGLGDDRAVPILDYVNAAKEDVLTGQDWKDDVRHDGVLLTRAAVTSTTAQFSAGTQSLSDATLLGSSSDYRSDVITRFEYQGDVTSSNAPDNMDGTVWRVKWLQDSGAVALGNIDHEWPGVSTGTGKVKYFAAEYMMPDTVREVVSVTHTNGTALKLDHIDPGATFDSWFPDPTVRYAAPEYAAVGGYDIPTNASAVVPDPKLRMVVFPIPDAAYRLNYSYYYNHPVLVNATDKLQVSPEVASLIVEKAAADAVMGTQQRVEDGATMGAIAERRLSRRHKSNDRQPARRHVVQSWEGRGGRQNVNVGFPGVTIEGS